MSELTPITRVESYLDAIVNSGTPPLEDITRIETFLQAIYDNTVCQLTPITRIEMFLGKISGQNIVLPEPITRLELYLAAIAGEDVELPENPITRLEMYLAEWADSGDWTTISGAIVEFITQRAHKLKSCVVSLSPQQDLHGYDNPWPAGGGSNLVDKIASESFGGTVSADGLTATSKVYTATAGFNMARCVINNPFNVTSGDVLYISFDIRLLSGTIERAGLQPIGGQSYASIGTGKYDIVPKNTKTRISASTTINTTTDFRGIYIQGVNGTDAQIEISNIKVAKTADYVWTPYENVCPISGWTGCEVYDTGHNVWDEEWELGGIAGNTGLPYGATDRIRSKNYSSCKPNTTYYLFNNAQNVNLVIWWYDESKTLISSDITGTGAGKTTTSPEKARYFKISSYAGNYTTYNNNFSINYPSTDTEYHAYNGNSYPVTFGETVYGATPDIVSGEMPVTWEYSDLGARGWIATTHQGVTMMLTSISAKSRDSGTPVPALCSMYEASDNIWSSATLRDKIFSINYAGTLLYLYDSAYTDVATFKAAMSGVQLVYEPATPTQKTITPTPITAPKGYNAVWSDAGDIEVTVHGTPVEVETLQALNMLLGGAYHNNQTADDVSDDEALDIILGGENE